MFKNVKERNESIEQTATLTSKNENVFLTTSSAYHTKIIVTPVKTRIYVYDKPIIHGFKSEREDYSKRSEGLKREDSIFRSRDNIMDTINANVTPYSKFITLTTAETILDRDQFLKLFHQFRKNFKRKFGYLMPYVGIMERQKKRGIKEKNHGSWHIHLAVFIQEKLDIYDLISCWNYGHLDIVVLRDPGDIGRYMMKYLSKDNFDIELNKKVLFKSRNLKAPTLIKYEDIINPEQFDYISEFTLYQGDKTEEFDPDLLNHCKMYEIHHLKGGKSL